MTFSREQKQHMARAIELARRGWFTTRSNPRVGCVLVNDTGVIGEGWHEKAGLGHAEVNAIADAKSKGHSTKNSTAYVTLEPCSHQGKTGPCAQALIEAGVQRLFCAMEDPNPQVSGRGFAMLKEAGIDVFCGLLNEEAQALNPGFIFRMHHGRPFVRAKIAMSLDGKTAMASGESQWITGSEARQDVQRLRAESGAVISGSGTILADDASLNVRLERYSKREHFEQPLRVIIDSQHQVSEQAKVWQNAGACWHVGSKFPKATFSENVRHLELLDTKTQKVDLDSLLQKLAQEGVNDVLVEAGAELVGAFLEKNLVDELIIYMAPQLLGNSARGMNTLKYELMSQAIRLTLKECASIGEDLRLIYSVINTTNDGEH